MARYWKALGGLAATLVALGNALGPNTKWGYVAAAAGGLIVTVASPKNVQTIDDLVAAVEAAVAKARSLDLFARVARAQQSEPVAVPSPNAEMQAARQSAVPAVPSVQFPSTGTAIQDQLVSIARQQMGGTQVPLGEPIQSPE